MLSNVNKTKCISIYLTASYYTGNILIVYLFIDFFYFHTYYCKVSSFLIINNSIIIVTSTIIIIIFICQCRRDSTLTYIYNTSLGNVFQNVTMMFQNTNT